MQLGLEELSPGEVLQNRYRIIGKVGGGGMGIVYKAIDDRIAHRLVAIKEMRRANLNNEQLAKAKKQFDHETAILSSLNHPNLPRVYDSFEEQGRYYFVMEFIEGETLLQQLQRMQGRPLPVRLLVDYALQLCGVLMYLHRQRDPVIFRDLKPSNVMVTQDGHVFLIDFGIARLFKKGQLGDTEAFGTRGYMAPEIGIRQTDARSDLYSLGATLHHCLTCEPPDYAGQQFKFPPVLDFYNQVPVELDALIASMVEYNPDKRPKSASEVKQRLEHIKQQLDVVGVRFGNTGSFGGQASSFYVEPTEAGNLSLTQPARGQSSLNAIRSTFPPLLAMMFGLAKSGARLLLSSLLLMVHGVLVLCLSSQSRQSVYDWYLHIRVKLNVTGVWTVRFLLLLTAMLIGAVIFSSIIYTNFGHSYYRVELGMTFALLVSIIVVDGLMHHPVPRNILLCTGFFVAVTFLTLLASPVVQQASNGGRQPVTLNQVLTFGLVTIALIALVGKLVIHDMIPAYQVPSPTRWFIKLSHAAVIGIAGICFVLQYSFGKQEQIPLVASSLHPFAATILAPFTANDALLCILGIIAFISLLRIAQPFRPFDGFMLLLLALIFLPMQYTYGLAESGHILSKSNLSGLVSFNLLLFLVPFIVAFIACFSLPGPLEWIGQLAILVMAVVCSELQNFLGDQEPFLLFASHVHQASGRLPQLAAFGQFLFYALGIAVSILALRAFFFGMVKNSNAADRIAVLIVSVASGLIQWSFWQEEVQGAQSLSSVQPGTTALYGSNLALLAAYGLILVALLALVIVAANTLFRLPLRYSWLKQAEKLMDRLAVLGVVVVALLLLNFFGNRGLLALFFNPRDVTTNAPDIVITYNRLLMILLGFFGFIALLRLKYAFGWVERIAVLLGGVACMLILADGGSLQKMPLLSSDMQQVTGDVFSILTTDHVVAACVCISALISLFWLTRGKSTSDRVVPGIVFGAAVLFALIQYNHFQPLFLLIALILLMQGILIAAQIERVRQGNLIS